MKEYAGPTLPGGLPAYRPPNIPENSRRGYRRTGDLSDFETIRTRGDDGLSRVGDRSQVASPPFAWLALINLVFLLPVAAAIIVAVDMYHEEMSRSGRTCPPRGVAGRTDQHVGDPDIRFIDG